MLQKDVFFKEERLRKGTNAISSTIINRTKTAVEKNVIYAISKASKQKRPVDKSSLGRGSKER